MIPYYERDGIVIYCGDAREVLPTIPPVDATITDPPYAETSLAWDHWPDGWPALCARVSNVLWSFGSLRMFFDRHAEFAGWKIAQEIVWEKHNGTNAFNDRFRRVHELAVQFYRGEWADTHKAPVFTNDATKRTLRRKSKPQQWNDIGSAGSDYASKDGGPRLQTSVIYCRSCHGRAVHPTQKPEGIIAPLIEYSVPPGGIVLDPFCGSGTTLVVARNAGKRAIGIEVSEEYCEIAARRLDQKVLAFSE